MPANKTITSQKLRIFKLLSQTFKLWKGNFNVFTKIVLVIAIPSAILNILQTQGLIGEYGLLLSIAWSFSIIAILQNSAKKNIDSPKKIGEIFTNASGRLLQYIAISLIQIVFLLPAITGIFGAFLAVPVLNVPFWYFVPFGLVGIVLGSYLISRYIVAQSAGVIENQSIVGSFRQSSALTKGSRLRIILGYLVLIIVILLILTVVQFVLSLNQSLNENAILGGAIYVLESIVFVPIFFIYQVKIFEALSEKATS